MLDRIRNAFDPSALETEAVEIQNRLDKLSEDQEELRLAAGKLVVQQTVSFEQPREREIRRLNSAKEGVAAQIASLKKRRREIAEITRPKSTASKAIVSVPMSPDLQKAHERLADARAERQQLLVIARNVEGDAATRKFHAKLAAVEAEISGARKARGELLEPYYAEMNQALKPIISEAAENLHEAAGRLLDALQTLAEVAQVAPPAAPGLGNGLERVAQINRTPVLEAEAFARYLLGRT